MFDHFGLMNPHPARSLCDACRSENGLAGLSVTYGIRLQMTPVWLLTLQGHRLLQYARTGLDDKLFLFILGGFGGNESKLFSFRSGTRFL